MGSGRFSRFTADCDFWGSIASNVMAKAVRLTLRGNFKRQTARRNMAGNAVVEVSDATFDKDVLQSEQPVLVDFWAVWCGPCKAIAPIVDDLATAYAGKLKVVKVDVDQNSATPSRYGIRGIPALLIFKGGKVADQIVGYAPREVIEEKLNRVLALSAATVS
jgi:thioredoxin 1